MSEPDQLALVAAGRMQQQQRPGAAATLEHVLEAEPGARGVRGTHRSLRAPAALVVVGS